jgi:hypothetical protein
MDPYEGEARDRWGKSDEFLESERKTSKYSHSDFQSAKIDQEAATELFVYAYGNGLAIDSPLAQDAVRAHRDAISQWFYRCSVEMQKELALMYVKDKRFKEYYEGRARGLAQYVHDAIMAQ